MRIFALLILLPLGEHHKHMRYIFTILLYVLGAVTTVQSAVTTFDYDRIGARLLYSIAQDRHGFLWIGTDNGLRRFDGTRFKSYIHSEGDSTSINENTVRKIVIGENGDMWIATGDGLHKYCRDTDSFQLIHLRDLGFHGYIGDAISDGNGGVWFIVSGVGLYHVASDETTATKHEFDSRLNQSELGHMVLSPHNCLWFNIGNNGAIYRLDLSDNSTTFYGEIGFRILSITINKSGDPVAVTSTSICVLDKATHKFHKIDQNLIPDSFFGDSWPCINNNGIILTYSDGIVTFDGDKTVAGFDNFNRQIKSLGYDINLTAVTFDSFSNYWVANQRFGLIMLAQDDEPFHFIDIADFNKSNRQAAVTAMSYDGDNGVWVALSDKRIYHIAGNEKREPLVFSDGCPSAIYASGKQLFVWEDGLGLCEYNLTSGKKSLKYHAKEFEQSNGIVRDKYDNLYIAIHGHGVLKYNISDSSAQLYSDRNSGLANNWISSIYTSDGQRIWIGHSGGVSWLDTNDGMITSAPQSSLMRQVRCYTFASFNSNKVWIGSNRGLILYDAKKDEAVRYTTKDGLSDDVVCSVSTDNSGNVWCSTINGICKLNVTTNDVTRYYGGNGLVDKMYERCIGFQASDGQIYYAGAKGITYFNPKDVLSDMFRGNVILSDMSIKDKMVNTSTLSGGRKIISRPISDSDEINLSHADNSFSLFLSTSNFHKSENVNYEYRIAEKDSEWNKLPQGEAVLRYHYLDPGKYTLLIRALENGNYSPEKSITINIRHPWYLTPWAKLIYILILIGIAYMVYITLKRRRRHEIDEAKLKYFINISHEIRSPLSLVVGPIETLINKTSDKESIELMHTMHLNAMRIMSLINQLLDIRKIDKGKLQLHFSETELVDYTHTLLKIFKYEAESRHINLLLESDAPAIKAWIDINNMDKVLINLISNALKYTDDGGEIKIHISTFTDDTTPSGPKVKITVTDSGNGINIKDISKIFNRFYQSSDAKSDMSGKGFGIGLNLCKMLIDLHHGKIYASNRNDTQGSIFTIIIPAGRDHLSASEIVDSQKTTRELVLPQLSTPQETDINYDTAKRKHRRRTDSKILIVDDSDDVTDYLKKHLSDKYKIITADNGAKGLELANSEHPDLILSDVIMPVMDGIELLKRTKANVSTNHIPFVILSTQNEIFDRIKGLDYVADAYIGKPFALTELEATIHNLLENRMILKGKYSGAQEQSDKIKPIELQGNDDIFLERLIQITNDNIDNPTFNVEMLCGLLGISRVHLHRKMKSKMGISASDFIRNVRLKQACELLKNDDIDITQIAYAIGFTNNAHFATTFKKYYGITPTEYRASTRQDKIQE